MKLSIIVPIYKTEEYLVKCIDSLISVSENEFEILLINDGSPDNCVDIINNYVKEKKYIRAIHKVNGGLSSARNIGMKEAKGDYITFVDSDDFVENDFVSKLIAQLSHEKVDLFISGVFKDELSSNKTINYFFPEEHLNLNSEKGQEYLMTHDVFGSSFMHGKLFKNVLIKNFNLKFEDVSPHEDTIFFLNYLLHCNDIKFMEYMGYHYEIHPRPSLTKKLPNFNVLFKISEFLEVIYTPIFEKFNYINYSYRQRITSEYGIDQRIIAWYDIYLNKRLKYSERISLMKLERDELRKWKDKYGYRARRKNHQYFFSMIISSVPFVIIDAASKFFFNFLKK